FPQATKFDWISLDGNHKCAECLCHLEHMNADSPTGTDHSNPLTWDDASTLACYVIWRGHRISDDASLAQNNALGNTHQVRRRNDHILGKGTVNLRPNIALIVDTERLPTRCAHHAVSTEEVERASYRVALTPTIYSCP